MNDNSEQPQLEPASPYTVANEEDWLDDSPHRPKFTRIPFRNPEDQPCPSDRHQRLLPFVYALREAVFSSLDQFKKHPYALLTSTAARARRRRHSSLIQTGVRYCSALIIQPNDTFTGIRKALLIYLAYNGFRYGVYLDRTRGFPNTTPCPVDNAILCSHGSKFDRGVGCTRSRHRGMLPHIARLNILGACRRGHNNEEKKSIWDMKIDRRSETGLDRPRRLAL